jgi:glycosyltransferase involved in cell wall biosynthesis
MRILFIAPQVPWPTNEGHNQRSHALLRALAGRHEVTLSAPASPDERDECRDGLGNLIAGFLPVPLEMGRRAKLPAGPGRLRRLAHYAQDVLTRPAPYAFRYDSDDYRSLIARHRDDFDAVFCRYLRMLPVLKDFPKDRIVVDADDLHYLGLMRCVLSGSHGWGNAVLVPEMIRTYCYEQASFRRLARVLVCSDADFSRVRCGRKTIIRNGVDLPDPARLGTPARLKTIVFIGQMSYDPNAEGLRWFLDHVWPRLRQLVAEVRLSVVGRNARPETLPFADVPGVELVADVEETASWFSRAVLSLAPLRFGLGTRIKIIESLSCGRPVVATRIGAEGLDDIDETSGLFRVDDPIEMAGRIASLLDNPDEALALGARGQTIVGDRYTWEATTRQLAADFERWVSRGRRDLAPSTSGIGVDEPANVPKSTPEASFIAQAQQT